MKAEKENLEKWCGHRDALLREFVEFDPGARGVNPYAGHLKSIVEDGREILKSIVKDCRENVQNFVRDCLEKFEFLKNILKEIRLS